MRKSLGFALVVALAVSTVPALAGESFHALSRLPAIEQAALPPLPDAQLAAIEGAGKEGNDGCVCIVCLNLAVVIQVNVADGAYEVQLNAASADQGIFQGNWTTAATGLQVNMAAVTQSTR